MNAICSCVVSCFNLSLFQSSMSIGNNTHPVEFGLFFDIDGVITRGRTLLPHSRSAFRLLTDDSGLFLVPSIFVTNAGNAMRQAKATQLSDWLGIQVFYLCLAFFYILPLCLFHINHNLVLSLGFCKHYVYARHLCVLSCHYYVLGVCLYVTGLLLRIVYV